MASGAPAQAFFPIRELSSYHARWTIHARVTSKGPMRQFASRVGGAPGKVFHVDLLDAEGGEIRANFFSAAADQFHERLQVGKCYKLSGGTVRVANPRFNSCKHRYELVFDRGGVIEEFDDGAKIQAMQLHVVGLRTLQSQSLPCTVDLCGVVVSFGQPIGFTSREGKELLKRDFVIADDTGTNMAITLWGDRAKKEDAAFDGQPIVGLKGVVVKEWNGGRSGSLSEGGTLVFNPDLPEADRLRRWWAEGGAAQSQTPLSGDGGGGRAAQGRPLTLAGLRKVADQGIAQPETFNLVCRLALVQMRKQGEAQPLINLACQEPREGSTLACNRRVDSSGFCAACGRAGRTAARLILRVRFADAEDGAWITTFHEAAQQVLSMTADDAQCMERGESGREGLERAIRARYFREPLQLTVRAKTDAFNGESRVNITCVDARRVPIREHGRALLKEIMQMLA